MAINRAKICIAGFGRVGSAVADLLAPRFDIVGIRRKLSASQHKVFGFDIRQRQDFIAFLRSERPAAILLIITPEIGDKQGYLDSYYTAMQSIILSCSTVHIKPVIGFMSSTAVYAQDNQQWIDESSPTEPIGFNGTVLLQSEQLLAQSQLPYIIWRASGIYEEQSSIRKQWILKQPKDRWSNAMHFKDVCRAVAHLTELSLVAKAQNIYLLSNSAPHLLSQLLQLVNEPCPPLWKNRAVAGKRCSNKRLLDTGFLLDYPTRLAPEIG